MHAGQVELEIATVRRLVDEQFPAWADRSVRRVASMGTVNALFRLGDDLVARFPLVPQEETVAWTTLRSEAAAARELADVSPVPVAAPVALGAPGHGYPSPWSVQTWLPGSDGSVEDPAASAAFAQDLVGLLRALRGHDTRGRTFAGGGRGGHLPDHDPWMETCFEHSEGLLDVSALRRMWAELRALPVVDPDVMCHGDLTPGNVLVVDGRLVGLLDCGGFGPADPALDLVVAWHLLDEDQRAILRAGLGSGEVQWRRGMAWAFQQAMGLVWYYEVTNPTMSRWGVRTIGRLLAAS